MEVTRRALRAVTAATISAVLVAGLLTTTPQPAGAEPEPALPVVFVHGFSGSGAQYETQALRWAGNDYPNVVTAIDRISATPAVIYPILDDFFDDLIEQTGSPQVYAIGHSQGTAVMAGYLASSPERAARVAKYIGIDGLSLPACPGGVECRGIWARGSTTRTLGPDNVYLSNQGHTESVGSAESFAAQYEFLTGQAPETTLVLPEPPGQVEIAGRALNFPANTGIAGATVQLWEVDPTTGARRTAGPRAETVVDDTGNFGPWRVNGLQRHELTVIRQDEEGDERRQHFYYEPWIRDNDLIRLNLSPIGSPLSSAIDISDQGGGASIVRQKEWWAGNQLGPDDRLQVATTSAQWGPQGPFDVVNEATTPFSASTIAMVTFDDGLDRVSHPDQLIPGLGAFLTGVDVWYPATTPTDGTVSFVHDQRNFSRQQVVNTPNWPSSTDFMTVTFRDWVQDIETWPECRRARPSPCK
jgi:pimeloyl-ACP methyl ester carboxylesterase